MMRTVTCSTRVRLGTTSFVGHDQPERLRIRGRGTRAALAAGRARICSPDELDLELSNRVLRWTHQYASRDRIAVSPNPTPYEYRSPPGGLPPAWLRIFPNAESIPTHSFCAALGLCRPSQAAEYLRAHTLHVGGIELHPLSHHIPLPPPPPSYDAADAYAESVIVDGVPRGARLRPLHLLAHVPAPPMDLLPSGGWFVDGTVPPSAAAAYGAAVRGYEDAATAWGQPQMAQLRAQAPAGMQLPPIPRLVGRPSRVEGGGGRASGGVSLASCDSVLASLNAFHPTVPTVWDVVVSPALSEDAWITLAARLQRFGGRLPYAELFGSRAPRRAVSGAASAAAMGADGAAAALLEQWDYRAQTKALRPEDRRRSAASDALSGIQDAAADYAARDASPLDPSIPYHTRTAPADALTLFDACDVRRPPNAPPSVIRLTVRSSTPRERLGALCRAMGVRAVAARRVGLLTPGVDAAAATLVTSSVPPGGFRQMTDLELRSLWAAVAPTGWLPPPIAPSVAALVAEAEVESTSSPAGPGDDFGDILAPTHAYVRRVSDVRDVAMGPEHGDASRAPSNLGFFVRPT